MTNYGDTTAWIRLSYGSDCLFLKCEEWEYDDSDTKLIAIDAPNWLHTGFTPNTHKLQIKLKNVWVDTESDWNILKAQLKAAAQASTCTMRIQISSTPSYELIDGEAGADEIPVLIKDKKGYSKPYRGNGSNFVIKQMIFPIVGTAT